MFTGAPPLRGVLAVLNAPAMMSNMHGSPAPWLCVNGIDLFQEASTDLGQIADGVITTGCDTKKFDKKGNNTGNKGCDNRG